MAILDDECSSKVVEAAQGNVIKKASANLQLLSLVLLSGIVTVYSELCFKRLDLKLLVHVLSLVDECWRVHKIDDLAATRRK